MINKLFSSQRIDHKFSLILTSVKNKILQFSEDKIITSTKKALIDAVYLELKVNPLRLIDKGKDFNVTETQIDVNSRRLRVNSFLQESHYVDGTGVELLISYEGDDFLWNCTPNSWTGRYPIGEIKTTVPHKSNILRLYYEQRVEDDLKNALAFFEGQLKLIEEYIGYQNEDIIKFNKSLWVNIEVELNKRIGNVKRHDELRKMLSVELNINPSAPSLQPVELKRKHVSSKNAHDKKSEESDITEYGIYEKDFEHILSVIRHEGSTFETVPHILKHHGEEDLRSFVLAHLNGHYEGNATGETFRSSGKTDIRIEFENRAAFVGECKIWSGKKDFLSAIDQLLGYLVWRDCKASIIIFNKKNSGFHGILRQISKIIESHSQFEEHVFSQNGNEWRELFSSPGDVDRKITIHFFLFDLFCGN